MLGAGSSASGAAGGREVIAGALCAPGLRSHHPHPRNKRACWLRSTLRVKPMSLVNQQTSFTFTLVTLAPSEKSAPALWHFYAYSPQRVLTNGPPGFPDGSSLTVPEPVHMNYDI